MNICFVYEGKKIVTPPLTGSILPGITRNSVITLGRDLGYEVAEEMVDVHEMLADVVQRQNHRGIWLRYSGGHCPRRQVWFPGQRVPYQRL